MKMNAQGERFRANLNASELSKNSKISNVPSKDDRIKYAAFKEGTTMLSRVVIREVMEGEREGVDLSKPDEQEYERVRHLNWVATRKSIVEGEANQTIEQILATR